MKNKYILILEISVKSRKLRERSFMNDAFTYHHVANELKILEGGRIDKINMPNKDEVAFTVKNGKLFTLVLSANPTFARAYITTQKTENPLTPYAFLMHLRKHLTSAVIDKIEQIPFERVLKFSLTVKDLFGEEKFFLYAEIMGRYSNIILVNGEGKISECLLHFEGDLSAKRILLPGAVYALPPAQQAKRAICDKAELIETLSLYDGKTAVHNYLISKYIGFAPLTLKQAVIKSGFEETKNAEKLFDTITDLYKSARPCYVKKDGKITDFYAFPYETDGETVFTDTLCEAMDEYYRQTFSTNSYATGANVLKSAIKTATSRCEKKRETLLARIEEAEDSENDRILGELITANIYKIKYGDKSVKVFDYYKNEEREIALDVMLAPAQNAQKFYKRYNKKKKTVEMSMEMLEKTDELYEYLDTLLLSVNQASSQSDLDEISKEMENAGILPKKSKKQAKTVSKPRKYEVDGYTVLIGKNNVQNDELVKNSDGGYTWLHTQKIHGSHTVIQGKNVPIETIEKVARYSAFFSKATLSSNVPVDYTLIKYVKKPSGAMPGKVIYTNQQTVYVMPENPDSQNK